MKVRVINTEHHGTVFGDPIFLLDEDLESVDRCPACDAGSGQQVLSRSEGQRGPTLTLQHCSACAHVYLGRRPSSAWYQDYYARDWDTGRSRIERLAEPARWTTRLKERVRAVPGARRLWRAAQAIVATEAAPTIRDLRGEEMLCMLAGLGSAGAIKQLAQGGRVLELGSGHGGALSILKEAGFEAVGTEASEYRVAQCRERGLDVVQTPIDDLSAVASRGPFDFLYSCHVVEHLLDPFGTLEQAVALVRDGGYVYLEVPHAAVAEGLVKLLHYPLHSQVFCISSMTALLGRMGLTVTRIHADVNLHVVAQKGVDDFDFPSLRGSADPLGFLRGSGRWLESPGQLSIYFDDWHVRIERPDGDLVYDRARPYATRPYQPGKPSPLGRTFAVDVQKAGDDEFWPIRFIHAGDRAPIWMKYQ